MRQRWVSVQAEVGAIIRSSAISGAKRVFVSGNYDLWGQKVVRCSAGAHFYVPVTRANPETILLTMKNPKNIYFLDTNPQGICAFTFISFKFLVNLRTSEGVHMTKSIGRVQITYLLSLANTIPIGFVFATY